MDQTERGPDWAFYVPKFNLFYLQAVITADASPATTSHESSMQPTPAQEKKPKSELRLEWRAHLLRVHQSVSLSRVPA